MATYTIDFKASVEKDLRKVPKDRLPVILEKIEELAEVPLPSDSKKLSGAEHLYRVRVGDYRIIYEVVNKTNTVTIFYVRNRRSAYRGL
ncbi:type II toxin-antitoxin system RelE family toxin [Methanosarcina mazei]|uniref:RelE/StbE replicon stabilization toxin n=1 Tax=Methanosarcina mazei SarPi TaxID=1434115 RepID=A0A0E3RDX0_METMZ|nr:type II toxin-antitoxin system RelE/ParE family toxin [Methanosarcina mazei]AKB62099.1 RelE/StbE replicon stabilization toxin [Methanosarcina mazei SarPi]